MTRKKPVLCHTLLITSVKHIQLSWKLLLLAGQLSEIILKGVNGFYMHFYIIRVFNWKIVSFFSLLRVPLSKESITK